MLKITFHSEDVERAKALWEDAPRRFIAAMKRTVTGISSYAMRKAREFSPVLTGNLRRGYSLIPTRQVGSKMVGGFGNNVSYLAANEFGKHGTEYVRPHTRANSAGDRVQVRGFSRNANQPARPFLRPAISMAASAAPDIFAKALTLAIAGAAKANEAAHD